MNASITHSIASAPEMDRPAHRPTLLTISQFAKRNPAFTEPALRNIIFKSKPRHSSIGEIPGNGLAESGALIRLGRRVLINEDKFLAWVEGS